VKGQGDGERRFAEQLACFLHGPTDARPRRAAVSGCRATFVAYVCADYGLDCGVSAWFVALRGAVSVFDWSDPCASASLLVLFFSFCWSEALS
jgi:hypothetical protein